MAWDSYGAMRPGWQGCCKRQMPPQPPPSTPALPGQLGSHTQHSLGLTHLDSCAPSPSSFSEILLLQAPISLKTVTLVSELEMEGDFSEMTPD